MPLQNRVTPFSDIVAITQRGMFTGNRGVIHDPAKRVLLVRRWATKAWLICLCEYKGRRRAVMSTRSWTELFFLDEVTALAAGHRPCFFCRREQAEQFRAAWADGNGVNRPLATLMDAVLHEERLLQGRKRIHALNDRTEALPDGAMFAAGGAAYAMAGGSPYLWSPDGYQPGEPPSVIDGLLTPPSIVRALAAGYRPVAHASLAGMTG